MIRNTIGAASLRLSQRAGPTSLTIRLHGRTGKPIYYDFIELERGYPDLR